MLTFVLQLFPPKGNKTDGKKGSIRVSHSPSKLCISDKYLFFGQSLGRRHHQPTYLLPGRVYLLNINKKKMTFRVSRIEQTYRICCFLLKYYVTVIIMKNTKTYNSVTLNFHNSGT